MAKRQFKSESKRLLDLMVNSIYTHKEIFLRELISNANDAIDKLYYLSLSDENISFQRENFYIKLDIDKEKRTLSIKDTGLGMSEDELNDNLGIIAKSGSYAFKNENDLKDDVDIIGQFGVGFYSSFMVAKTVRVITKKFGSEDAFMWVSNGLDGYTIEKATKEDVGTEIILEFKDNTDNENYDEFLEEYKIRTLIKKYSDYIKYPIKMEVTKTKPKENDEKEMETYKEEETLNSMIPIWKKSKSELTSEDYNNFYKDKFHDFEEPIKTIHTDAEGLISYTALMFIPKRPPFDYYTKDFQKGLKLYSNGVLIMDSCSDLLPDCFAFVKGLVDSADLSLNISREILQQDRQLKTIATNLKKKIKNELLDLQRNNKDDYIEFFKNFGRQIKFGIYDNFGAEKDFLQDLVLFYSSKEKKLVSLKEYVERMSEDQKNIYYATGESIEKIEKLPQTELFLDKGFEVLYLTEDIDEFALKILTSYMEKQFKSISSDDIDIENEEEKKAKQELEEQNKDLFAFLKETLKDEVKDVKPTTRLKSHPICISSEGAVSLEMEKVLNQMPNDNNIKAERILEININHKVFETLKTLFETDKEKLQKYANVLYNNGLLIEGIAIADPSKFSNDICDLI